jgi:hypothetical protein
MNHCFNPNLLPRQAEDKDLGVNNVVFVCGAYFSKDDLYHLYAGADSEVFAGKIPGIDIEKYRNSTSRSPLNLSSASSRQQTHLVDYHVNGMYLQVVAEQPIPQEYTTRSNYEELPVRLVVDYPLPTVNLFPKARGDHFL